MALYDALLAAYDSHCDWDQSFFFNDGHGGVDLAPATGVDAIPMLRHPCQPEDYPSGTTYLFDPNKYSGMESYWELTNDIQNALPESFMDRRGMYFHGATYTAFRLTCSFGKVSDACVLSKFEMEKFQKPGTKIEPTKQRRGKNK